RFMFCFCLCLFWFKVFQWCPVVLSIVGAFQKSMPLIWWSIADIVVWTLAKVCALLYFHWHIVAVVVPEELFDKGGNVLFPLFKSPWLDVFFVTSGKGFVPPLYNGVRLCGASHHGCRWLLSAY